MEKILNIEECFGFNGVEDAWCEQDGFKITTTEQEIYLVIDNMQCCCENWGYFMSEEKNMNKFIGAELLNIKITDTLSNSITKETLTKREFELNDDGSIDIYEGGIMFVDIITSNGVLQFIAYNEHNGYYGHEAWVISKQLKYNECL